MGGIMKKINLLLIVAVLMSILSGCSSSSAPELPTNPNIKEDTYDSFSEEQSGEESATEDQNTVKTEGTEKQILTITAYSLYRDYLTARKHKFMELHPDVDIRLTFYSTPSAYSDNTYTTRLATDLMGGSASDIILVDNPVLWNYGELGYFEGLYQYLEKDVDISKESFYPEMLKALEIGGELYVLPVIINYKVLLLNTEYEELLQNELAGKYTLTYYDLAKLCDIVKDSLPEGTVLYPTNAYSAKFALIAEMDTYFDKKEKYVNFSNSVDLIEFVEPYTVPGMNEGYTIASDENSLFTEGVHALGGFWPALSADFSFEGGGYMLANTKGEITFELNLAYAINSSSQNKDLAWEFLKFSTEDVHDRGDGIYISQHIPARQDEFWKNYTQRMTDVFATCSNPLLEDEEYVQSVFERMQELQYKLNNFGYGYSAVFWEALEPAVKDYGLGLIDAQGLADRIQEKMEAYANE